MTTNLHISIEGKGSARCTAYTMHTHIKDVVGDTHWTTGNRMDLRLAIEDGRWKITSMKIVQIWASGNRDVISGSSSDNTSSKN